MFRVFAMPSSTRTRAAFALIGARAFRYARVRRAATNELSIIHTHTHTHTHTHGRLQPTDSAKERTLRDAERWLLNLSTRVNGLPAINLERRLSVPRATFFSGFLWNRYDVCYTSMRVPGNCRDTLIIRLVLFADKLSTLFHCSIILFYLTTTSFIVSFFATRFNAFSH